MKPIIEIKWRYQNKDKNMIGGKEYKMTEYNKSIRYQQDLMKIGKR